MLKKLKMQQVVLGVVSDFNTDEPALGDYIDGDVEIPELLLDEDDQLVGEGEYEVKIGSGGDITVTPGLEAYD